MTSHIPIWCLNTEQVYLNLNTSPEGLADSEALIRAKQYGVNELPEPPRRSLVWRFVDQLTHFMALLLWVAGILAFIAHIPELGWAIWAVIWLNAIFSFSQEYQAEKALSALKNVLPAQAKVYRGGILQNIPARELVIGDVIQLEEGDRLSADARLVEAENLYVDVSILTGESLPISRHSLPVTNRSLIPLRNGTPILQTGEQTLQEKWQPGEIPNLVLAGSTIASGRGKAVVYATGARTEFGHVAHLTTTVKEETSTLEIEISRIVRLITTLAVSMGTVIFLLSYFLVGMEIRESFIFGIGIIVAFVPEGLLPTVTLALAMGVQRMAKRNALVRRLSAVEALSATTVVCTDKTGTLTQNEMTVRGLWVPNINIEVTGVGYEPKGEIILPPHILIEKKVNLLLAGAALCSNARLIHLNQPSRWQEIGDPTEAALLVVALKAGLELDKLHKDYTRRREVPFDSRRRMMTVVVNWQKNDIWELETPYLSITKGAPLEVLRHCNSIQKNGQIEELTRESRQEIISTNDKLASQGFRVLGIAIRPGDETLLTLKSGQLEQHLTFIGLIVLYDPPRPEVKIAIAQCHQAGIAVSMITGDYGLTAQAIAENIGLVQDKAIIITGEDLGHLSDAQLRQFIHHHPQGLIFARVMPEHKLRIVQSYQSLGHIVAVTGDGVNDAPALKAANIGIAMGKNGTDVAREAADIVLLDDNFATIVTAIQQGRGVYQNIRKFMTYILASNVAEVVPFILMILFKIPPALTILQILAIDLGTDLIPALALGAELPEPKIMEQPPRNASRPLLDRPLLWRAYCWLGLMEAIAGMTAFLGIWLGYGYSFSDLQGITPAILSHTASPEITSIYQQATTITLATIVACQDGNVFACRSEKISAFQMGFFHNRLIWLGIAVEWTIILSIIYIPFLQGIFDTTPIPLKQWFILLICPPLILLADTLGKKKYILLRNQKE